MLKFFWGGSSLIVFNKITNSLWNETKHCTDNKNALSCIYLPVWSCLEYAILLEVFSPFVLNTTFGVRIWLYRFSLSIRWTVSCMMSDQWFYNDWIREVILIVASVRSIYHDILQSRSGKSSLLIYFSDLFWDS